MRLCLSCNGFCQSSEAGALSIHWPSRAEHLPRTADRRPPTSDHPDHLPTSDHPGHLPTSDHPGHSAARCVKMHELNPHPHPHPHPSSPLANPHFSPSALTFHSHPNPPPSPSPLGREVRELLDANEFPGDDIPIVRGSALCAHMHDACMHACTHGHSALSCSGLYRRIVRGSQVRVRMRARVWAGTGSG